jgi:cytochrome oxidase Cu insertion factor (SCO1/SenC/PrrC family)
MTRLTRLMVPSMLALSLAAALPAAPQVDVNTLGPQVGQRALPFSLPDQNGKPQTLASVAGSKGTMLVFFRSADW